MSIGDAVMSVFRSPLQALAALHRIQQKMKQFNVL
jgi:class 3 adenylate cyclase